MAFNPDTEFTGYCIEGQGLSNCGNHPHLPPRTPSRPSTFEGQKGGQEGKVIRSRSRKEEVELGPRASTWAATPKACLAREGGMCKITASTGCASFKQRLGDDICHQNEQIQSAKRCNIGGVF